MEGLAFIDQIPAMLLGAIAAVASAVAFVFESFFY